MDEASKSASVLLNELNTSWHTLADISNPWRRYGQISKPYIMFNSAHPFQSHIKGVKKEVDALVWMGIHWQREVRSMESLNFEIDLMWDKDYWYIQTEVSEEIEYESVVLRTFPERQTAELDTCLEYLRQAIQDIASCGDIVMARIKNT